MPPPGQGVALAATRTPPPRFHLFCHQNVTPLLQFIVAVTRPETNIFAHDWGGGVVLACGMCFNMGIGFL